MLRIELEKGTILRIREKPFWQNGNRMESEEKACLENRV